MSKVLHADAFETALILAWKLFTPEPFTRSKENITERKHREEYEGCPCNACGLRSDCGSECYQFDNYVEGKRSQPLRCRLQRLLH